MLVQNIDVLFRLFCFIISPESDFNQIYLIFVSLLIYSRLLDVMYIVKQKSMFYFRGKRMSVVISSDAHCATTVTSS